MSTVIYLEQEWYVGDLLDSGGFGRLHLAHLKDGEAAVIKFVPKAPGADRELLFVDLEELPNVVPVLDRGEWNDFLVLVMPKADKSLRDYLSDNIEILSIDDTLQVLSDVTKALVAIEGRIVHRDIKPDNILLLDGHWCLADFGISRYAEATTAPDTRKFYMTSQYAAPEQWRGEQATSATDVYSLGVVAYELLAGQLPFMGPEEHHYRQQHLDAIPKQISRVPLKLQSLIDECLYKSPQARPRPQNLLVRLTGSVLASSEAASRLQQANAIAVQRQSEIARQESVAKSEAKRRQELLKGANRSLSRVVDLLSDQILSNAPASEQSDSDQQLSWTLNEATLSLAQIQLVSQKNDAGVIGPPFDIISYTYISILVEPERHGYKGRSHSLWYCDAQEVGVFRWYETAFMINPFNLVGQLPFVPVALDPGGEAYGALYPGTTLHQVAWPFTSIDQGDEDAFIERWIEWFAEAAQGLLRHPSHMPERNPQGSWRHEG